MSAAHRRQLADVAETLHNERQLRAPALQAGESWLVLAADEARFLPQAMREVEVLLERVRLGEGRRRIAIQRLARAAGETEDRITLTTLVQWAPEPYRTMFVEHRDQFRRLTTEIEQPLSIIGGLPTRRSRICPTRWGACSAGPTLERTHHRAHVGAAAWCFQPESTSCSDGRLLRPATPTTA